MTAVGFEPTRLATVELESTPLDRSGKLSMCGEHFVYVSFQMAAMTRGILPRQASCRLLLRHGAVDIWGYGAMAARLTPDQKVGSSNLSGLIFARLRREHA